MKGDFSRFAHDRRKHYSRVLKQQGRVDLEADHNEGAEIHHHLDRVTRRDVIGASGVPREGGAFRLEPTSDNADLLVSEGRFYLDGLVVEVDSTPLRAEAVQGDAFALRVPAWEVDGRPFEADQWVEVTAAGQAPARLRVTGTDRAARKLVFAQRVDGHLDAPGGARVRRLHTLRTQADAPDAAALRLQPGTPLLLYLEVFERHVTEIEDPSLREIALGGPDTTTRVQTVWRLLAAPAGSAEHCGSPVANWPPQPGGGRLTTTATATPKEDDPCVLPPEGGYRGVENRLYRVEVHKAGDVGTATYKWSRDNGAVAYAVDSFLPPEGTPPVVKSAQLRSLPRDRSLALRKGDWVEVTDDEDELLGRAGALATVEDVDLAERTVRLSVDLAAYKARGRRPKLRRWDMKGLTEPGSTLTAEGILIDGTTDVLEDGVTVEFSGRDFRAGDWWSFAARVATADVERLHARPPFNEPRRHARIALLTWEMDPLTMQARPRLHDCRKPFDPLTEPCGCCCDVTVGDGVESFGDHADLQAAIDSVQGKGRVCVLKGTHVVKRTVEIRRDGLEVHACGSARILGPPNAPTFLVEGCKDVALEGLHVAADAATPIVRIRQAEDVRVVGCAIGPGPQGPLGPAVEVDGAGNVLVEECRLRGEPAVTASAWASRIAGCDVAGGVVLHDGCYDVVIEDNRLSGGSRHGVTLGWAPPLANPAEFFPWPSFMSGIVIRRNSIRGTTWSGIATREPRAPRDVLPSIADLVVADNDVQGCVAGPPPYAGARAEAFGGIVLRSLERATIRGNRVASNGQWKERAVGILAQGNGVDVSDNLVQSNGGVADPPGRPYDVAFEAMPPGEEPGSTREVDGVTFEVLDHTGQPARSTRIVDWGDGAHGLDCGWQARVLFPAPVSDLRMRVGAYSGPVRLVATSESGGREARSTAAQNEPEEVAFTLAGVREVEILAPSNEFLLMRVQAEGDPGPQRLQGGVFVLGPFAVAMDDDEAEWWKWQKWYSPFWSTATELVVHDNVVQSPRGPALVVVASGGVSVQDNDLRTDGVSAHGDPVLDGAGCLLVSSGRDALFVPPRPPAQAGEMVMLADEYELQRLDPYAIPEGFDQRVLVQGNRATLEEWGARRPRALARLASEDDLLVQGNQFRLDLGERHVGWAVRAEGKTLQVRGNRFYERPNAADLSLLAVGGWGYVLLNVAMHCVVARGRVDVKAEENIVQLRTREQCDETAARYDRQG